MKKYLYLCLSVFLIALIVLPSTAFGFSLSSLMGGFFQFVMEQIGFKTEISGYCWFCPITENLFSAAGRMSEAIIKQTKSQLLILLGLGTFFFVAFKVGSTVIKLQEVDLMQFMGDLFKTLGRVMIAAAILGGSNFVVSEIITPLLGLALNFSLDVMSDSNIEISNKLYKSLAKHTDYSGAADKAVSNAQSAASSWANAVNNGNDPGVFSPFLVKSVIALMAKASANLVIGMGVGLVLILTSMVSSFIFPDVQNVMSGMIIFFSFAALYITIPFQLINFVIQLTFVVALLPFWVILWAFPATAQYAQNAFKLFLQTCLCFVIFGIMVVLVMNLVGYMLPNSDTILAEMIPGYEWIAGKHANVVSKGVLTTLALGFLSKELLKGTGELASRITNVYGTNIGEQAAASAAGVAGATMMGAWGTSLGLTQAFTGGYDQMQKSSKSAVEFGKGIFGMEKDEGLFTGGSPSKAAPTSKYQGASTSGTAAAAAPTTATPTTTASTTTASTTAASGAQGTSGNQTTGS